MTLESDCVVQEGARCLLDDNGGRDLQELAGLASWTRTGQLTKSDVTPLTTQTKWGLGPYGGT